jgi:hypothetical protein
VSLISIQDGNYVVNLHAGQSEAWESKKRFIAVLAGTQSGKTSFGPIWLWREMLAHGPGDYLAVTASNPLFKLKMLPEMRKLFVDILKIARYWSSAKILEIRDPSTGEFWAQNADDPMYARIILCSAEAPGALESATAKAAWIDEAGLIPDALPWEAVRRRLSLAMGRILLTTTLYDFGWIKRILYDPWQLAHCNHPEIDVISFDSIANPLFSREEWESARRSMEEWKFDMMYRGRYTRPFGMIYQSFNPKRHVIPRRELTIPDAWTRYLGADFGGANLAGVFFAEDPAPSRLFLYRIYLEGNKTIKEHARLLLEGEPSYPFAVGGSASEGQWRDDFAAAGLAIMAPPITDVEVGITRVHSFFANNKIVVFRELTAYIDQLNSYSREINKATGEVTEKIRNKAAYHYMDATRYILSYLYDCGVGTSPASIGSGGAQVTRETLEDYIR